MRDDDDPADDGRRRVDRREPGIDRAHADLGVLLASAVEVGARLAGQRVDRDQPAVERAFDDPARRTAVPGAAPGT